MSVRHRTLRHLARILALTGGTGSAGCCLFHTDPLPEPVVTPTMDLAEDPPAPPVGGPTGAPGSEDTGLPDLSVPAGFDPMMEPRLGCDPPSPPFDPRELEEVDPLPDLQGPRTDPDDDPAD